MPLTSRAEFYFILAMMFLILIVSGASVFVFFKTYRKEMREREERKLNKKRGEINGHSD